MLSRAPEIKRALYDGLTTALAGNGEVTVHLGTPPPETNPYQYVIVGPEDTPTRVSQEWRGLGGTRTETIDVTIQIKVFKAGQEPTEAEDRSWDVAGAVGDLLADRTTFDPNVFSSIPDEITQTTETFADGRTSTINLLVQASAVTTGI